ncbi:MAG: GWxTD domain-containing protein, partial [Thermoanaerobaculia bacterium]|nr:GWxTD domain-containing protein [Thermoanaerobaculia bacterium]
MLGGTLRRAARWGSVTILLFLALPLPGSQGDRLTRKLTDAERKERIVRLDDSERAFVELAGPIMPEAELDAFLHLETEQERAAAIESFWRNRAAGEPVEEWRRQYEARLDEARQLFSSRTSDRAQVYLLRGRPATMMPVPCPDYFRPIEVWTYESLGGRDEHAVLLFYKPAPNERYQLLVPDEEEDRPIDELVLSEGGKEIGPVPILLGIPANDSDVPRPLALDCPAGKEVLEAIRLVKSEPKRVASLLDRSVRYRQRSLNEPRLTMGDPEESEIPVEATITYPGKRGSR